MHGNILHQLSCPTSCCSGQIGSPSFGDVGRPLRRQVMNLSQVMTAFFGGVLLSPMPPVLALPSGPLPALDSTSSRDMEKKPFQECHGTSYLAHRERASNQSQKLLLAIRWQPQFAAGPGSSSHLGSPQDLVCLSMSSPPCNFFSDV